MYTKLYDIHFEIGAEQSLYYARNVLGNNAIEFKQFASNIANAMTLCIGDMNANGAFQSLGRDPSISKYPMSPHQHYMITNSTYGAGGHSHHQHTPATPAIIQYFDLHFECAIDSATGIHHAKAVFVAQPGAPVPGLLVYHNQSKFLDDALCDVVNDMEGDRFFDDLMKNPLMSQYPIPGGSGQSSVSPSSGSISSSSKKKEEVKRRLPSDIGTELIHPACQDVCTSFEHFRDTKCRSMCEWRF